MNRLAVASVIVLAAFVAVLHAQDKLNPSGTWKWMQMGRGGQSLEATLKLKVDGDKVSGTVSMPGPNDQTRETPIADGKYKEGELSFSVTVEGKNQKRTTKYNGKVSADTIKGKMERDQDGKAQSTDWEAKRAKDDKK